MLARRTVRRRRGLAIVESALVLGVFSLLFFGIFEYCRFLLVLHTANNAARDGARYAAVNVNKPTTFDNTDFTDGNGKVFPSVQKYTKARMGGVDKQIEGFQVAVYPVDVDGLALTPIQIRPKTKSTASPKTYPDPFDPNDTNKTPWNQAVFTERIAVTIDGTYKPILPGFLLMPSSIPVNVTAMAGSEG